MLFRILKAKNFKNERGYLCRIIEEINGYIEGPLHIWQDTVLDSEEDLLSCLIVVIVLLFVFHFIFAGLRLELFLMTLFLV